MAPNPRINPRGNGSLTNVTNIGKTSTQPTTWRSTVFGVCCTGSNLAVIQIRGLTSRHLCASRSPPQSDDAEGQLPVLLQYLERRGCQKPRTAFFFRVIQHVFINTIQQITRQGNVEFLSLAQVLGDINVHHGPPQPCSASAPKPTPKRCSPTPTKPLPVLAP